MNELLYDIDTEVIAGVLLVSMVVAIETGFRIGWRTRLLANEDFKSHINAIQGTILGILALLLGFSFSLALQRYDSRSEAVVSEANAIGTAYLRAQLLPASQRDDVRTLLREYVDLRTRTSALSVVTRTERDQLLAKTAQAQNDLWVYARKAAEQEPNPVTSGLYIQALNDLIDSFGTREAALNRHVPEIVLLLLCATFLMAGAIVGFTAGVAGLRPSTVSYFMVVLMVVIVFIVLDLDRPRRGLIVVSQQSMDDLQSAIRAETDIKPPTR